MDAFYVSVTTLTTVGLGDLSPTTTLGKLFTVIYIFAGLSLVLGFYRNRGEGDLQKPHEGTGQRRRT